MRLGVDTIATAAALPGLVAGAVIGRAADRTMPGRSGGAALVAAADPLGGIADAVVEEGSRRVDTRTEGSADTRALGPGSPSQAQGTDDSAGQADAEPTQRLAAGEAGGQFAG